MKRVTGIGGLFFTCADPEMMKGRDRRHLGIDAVRYGAACDRKDAGNPEEKCSTAWGPFEAGRTVAGTIREYSYGRFGWIMGPEGNKTGLWEPVDDHLCDDRKP